MNLRDDWVSQFSLGAISFAAVFFVAGQLRMVSVDRTVLKAQTVSLEATLNELKRVKASAEEAVANREETVKKAQQNESVYAGFLRELAALSRSDEDARTITQKWEIRVADAPSQAKDAPSSAPAESAPAKAKGGSSK
jgi:hypothetical protein